MRSLGRASLVRNEKMIERQYDVIVVGAGHAGCEAASAAARMGCRTCLITMDMTKIAQMSCNPAIGGIAKGQIIREVDALGGMSGIVTDRTAIQFRMLNRSKGPAMWSPRSQCDRMAYSREWRRILENTPNLHIWQDQVDSLIVEDGKLRGVRTIWGLDFFAPAVVITAGTFLNGLMHIGRHKVEGGRIAEPAVHHLTESITALGIRSARMKTGTPVRLDARSIDFSQLEPQVGEDDFHRFSYITGRRPLPQMHCWLCQTNETVHTILRSGPATTFAKKDSLPRGTKLTSLTSGANWNYVKLSDGTYGYINKKYLSKKYIAPPAPSPSPAPTFEPTPTAAPREYLLLSRV